MAVVTNTRSPQTIGDDHDSPGIGVFHATLSRAPVERQIFFCRNALTGRAAKLRPVLGVKGAQRRIDREQ